MSVDPNLIQEIEQAIIQKQALLASLKSTDLSLEEQNSANQKIKEIELYLGNVFNLALNSASNRPNLNELSLQSKLTSIQKALDSQIAQNQNLQNTIQTIQKNGVGALVGSNGAVNPALSNQISGYINTNYGSTSANLGEKIIDNTSKLTGIKPNSIKDYLHLAWDYVARDRLPKLLSTRLWLVVGGGYLTEMLGQDTTLKIVSIVLLVVFYIVSEVVVKMSSDASKVNSQSMKFY